MGFEARLSGGRDLLAVRKALKQIGDKGLGQQLSKGLRAAVKPLPKEIKAEVPKAMPSGYAPLLAKSLRYRTNVQTARTTARMTYRVYGDGQRERRDVPALNRGRLRHPVFGRRRQPWVDQRVRKGFVDRPVDRLQPEIRRQMNAVIDYIADEIKKA